MPKKDVDSCVQSTDTPKRACAKATCPLSNANTLAFFIPFAIVNTVNQFQANAGGPACDACVISQMAPGILAGFVILALYRGVKAWRRHMNAAPVDNLPIQADYMEKAKFSTAEFEAEKSRASSK